ncbi:MAG: hypothetical protein RIA65_04800 [Woeseia sp.]
MPTRLLLGPQRPIRNIGEAIRSAGLPEGKMAVISAGWQEAEGDIDDVRELVKRPLVDLQLYKRTETLLATDNTLLAAYRQRQDRLKELQGLYQIRLKQLLLAARQTLAASGDAELIAVELRHAVSQLRALDRHHLRRVQTINTRFDNEYPLQQHSLLAEQFAQIDKILSDCETVIITGGNALVLLNRLRMFGTHLQLESKNIVAWSAGAMILSDRIVLFHDRLPQGRRGAELLGPGAGLLPGYVFMPDARRRLRTKDEVRIGLMSRRFSPASCITLDSGAQLRFSGRELKSSELARRMTNDGLLENPVLR